jgi:hypothetical protein
MISPALLVLVSFSPNFPLLLYADPGSGMLIWQLATAAGLGVLFYARTILRRIRLLIRGLRTKGERPAARF